MFVSGMFATLQDVCIGQFSNPRTGATMNNLAAYGFEMVFTGRGSYYGEIRTTEFGGAPLKRKPNPWMMLPKKRPLTKCVVLSLSSPHRPPVFFRELCPFSHRVCFLHRVCRVPPRLKLDSAHNRLVCACRSVARARGPCAIA